MPEAHNFLATLAVVLCAAAVTTVVFQWLKQPVVLGYLLAGMIIGPYIPVPVVADVAVVQALSELGVILLMFSLGLEFSLKRLMRVGLTAGVIAIVQCSLMIWLGFSVGQAFGWTRLECIYAGAVVSISSTTIIVKAFEEQHVSGEFTHIVFGVLIVEDLIAIMLLTILTTLSNGEKLSPLELAETAGKLALFLAALIIVGLLTVPRLIRAVVALKRQETTVVASVGLAFGFAYLALKFQYSVALGAFIAGSLVAESGVAKKVEQHVLPVRDIFAAIFFVSVGMLINPTLIAEHWFAAVVFFVVVVCGMLLTVTLGAFVTGQSVQNSVKTAMSLAQIGEFSFIIASLGVATGATGDFLFPIAVAVSAATTMLTPWLIRAAEPAAALVDRKLPRALQTFVALYGSWLERLRSAPREETEVHRVKNLTRWLALDAIVVGAIVIGASVQLDWLSELAQQHLGASPTSSRFVVIGGAILASSPFWIGMIRSARTLGLELAERAFPAVGAQRLDTADAPRRLLVVTLQLAIVVLVGAPLMAITRPFVPPLQGLIVFVLLIGLLGASFWRRATNLQGHTRAAAQVIAEAIAEQMRDGHSSLDGSSADVTRALEGSLADVNRVMLGLGSPVPIQLAADSPAVGKSLAELNLRGLTGATILTIKRGKATLLVPAGRETLQVGDVLALAGTAEANEAAKAMLLGLPEPLPEPEPDETLS